MSASDYREVKDEACLKLSHDLPFELEKAPAIQANNKKCLNKVFCKENYALFTSCCADDR